MYYYHYHLVSGAEFYVFLYSTDEGRVTESLAI